MGRVPAASSPSKVMVAAGAALLLLPFAASAFFEVRNPGSLGWQWPLMCIMFLPAELLGAALLATARRQRGWMLVGAIALGFALMPASVIAWGNLNHYGTEPSYYVESYDDLKAELARDCPDLRYPDLSRYEQIDGLRYKVSYDGGRLHMRNRRYTISYERFAGAADGGAGMRDEGQDAGVRTDLSGLLVRCYDLRSYDGHSKVAPEVRVNAQVAGVGAYRWQRESDAGESYTEGVVAGEDSCEFIVDGYFYRVKGYYVLEPDLTSEEAAARRQGAADEVSAIAESLACSER